MEHDEDRDDSRSEEREEVHDDTAESGQPFGDGLIRWPAPLVGRDDLQALFTSSEQGQSQQDVRISAETTQEASSVHPGFGRYSVGRHAAVELPEFRYPGIYNDLALDLASSELQDYTGRMFVSSEQGQSRQDVRMSAETTRRATFALPGAGQYTVGRHLAVELPASRGDLSPYDPGFIDRASSELQTLTDRSVGIPYRVMENMGSHPEEGHEEEEDRSAGPENNANTQNLLSWEETGGTMRDLTPSSPLSFSSYEQEQLPTDGEDAPGPEEPQSVPEILSALVYELTDVRLSTDLQRRLYRDVEVRIRRSYPRVVLEALRISVSSTLTRVPSVDGSVGYMVGPPGTDTAGVPGTVIGGRESSSEVARRLFRRLLSSTPAELDPPEGADVVVEVHNGAVYSVETPAPADHPVSHEWSVESAEDAPTGQGEQGLPDIRDELAANARRDLNEEMNRRISQWEEAANRVPLQQFGADPSNTGEVSTHAEAMRVLQVGESVATGESPNNGPRIDWYEAGHVVRYSACIPGMGRGGGDIDVLNAICSPGTPPHRLLFRAVLGLVIYNAQDSIPWVRAVIREGTIDPSEVYVPIPIPNMLRSPRALNLSATTALVNVLGVNSLYVEQAARIVISYSRDTDSAVWLVPEESAPTRSMPTRSAHPGMPDRVRLVRRLSASGGDE